MIPLSIIFGFSIVGMGVVVGRHIFEIFHIPESEVEKSGAADKSSRATVFLASTFDAFEDFLFHGAIPAILRTTEKAVVILEKCTVWASKKSTAFRIAIHRRRSSLNSMHRESPYWREVHIWKQNNGSNKKSSSKTKKIEYDDDVESQDVSYHDIE
ncbi:hypothetical protein ACFL3E_00990 [Patescibacteria group bacterium]